jgi:hypothetical protein
MNIDWDNVEWEDNSCSGEEKVESLDAEAESSDHVRIRDDSIKINLDEEVKVGKRKREVLRYNREDREMASELHRDQLMRKLSRAISQSEILNEDELVLSVMSTMPSDLLSQPNHRSISDVRRLGNVIEWFRTEFNIIQNRNVTPEEGRDGSIVAADLLQVLKTRSGSAHQLNQIFVIAARLMLFVVRYTVAVDVPPPVPSAFPKVKSSAMSRKRAAINKATDNDINSPGNLELETDISSYVEDCDELPVLAWCEVLLPLETDETKSEKKCPDPNSRNDSSRLKSSMVIDISNTSDEDEGCNSSSRSPASPGHRDQGMVCVEAVYSGSVNMPKKIQSLRIRQKQVFLAISVDVNGSVYDVTPRYVNGSDLNMFRTKLYDFEWLKTQLSHLSGNSKRSGDNSNGDNDILIAEEKATHAIPATLSGFKGHKYYTLPSLLRADEAINPNTKKICGTFKGEPILHTNCVEKLFSAKEWRRRSRSVIANEEPIRTRSFHRRTEGQISTTKISVPLFGSWQTETASREIIVDGILPLNEFGNIEIIDYNTSLLPIGSLYVQEECAIEAAKRLGLPHAPAVVGFEVKARGISYPIIEGAVVLEEHEKLIREVAITLLGEKLLSRFKRDEQKCAARWALLARGLLGREELRLKYGH